MPLAPGSQLGPYEIAEPIGKGGMGEVYRARDPRMGRDVAIKISAERFSERFDREVRAIAALNHPNICTLHDVGPNYLVMELVEGPTLAERIAEGAIPLEESLNVARQITAGLEAAHEKGITHRDLKPGNVKIKPDGTVKVLDFGLAKVGPRMASGSDPEDSPTLSMAATQAGVILGTAAYMSPDEALLKSGESKFPQDISPDGRFLLYSVTGRPTDLDIWKLPLDGSGKEEPYIKTDAFESQAHFSPGGDYVVYTVNASGPTRQGEIYVQPFPDPSKGKWKVSEGGGSQPLWSADGKEIFYISADSKMIAVEVSTTPVFKLGNRKELFAAPMYGGGRVLNVFRYDVANDGRRFLINSPVQAAPSAPRTTGPPITVILNWQALLRK